MTVMLAKRERRRASSCWSGKAVMPLRIRPRVKRESQRRMERRSWELV
jgi:hypothetical protein